MKNARNSTNHCQLNRCLLATSKVQLRTLEGDSHLRVCRDAKKKMLGMILEGVHCCELPSISQILVRDLIVPHLGCKYVESQLTLAQNQPEFRRCPDCNLPPVENSSFDDRNRFRVWNLEEMKFWYVLFVKQSSLLGKIEKILGVYVSFWWVEIHPFHVEQSRNTIFEYIWYYLEKPHWYYHCKLIRYSVNLTGHILEFYGHRGLAMGELRSVEMRHINDFDKSLNHRCLSFVLTFCTSWWYIIHWRQYHFPNHSGWSFATVIIPHPSSILNPAFHHYSLFSCFHPKNSFLLIYPSETTLCISCICEDLLLSCGNEGAW